MEKKEDDLAHSCTVKVRFYELDPYNHVNHAVYLHYFEYGRITFLQDKGYNLASDVGKYNMIVTRIDIRYRRSAELNDVLEIITEPAGSERFRGKFKQRIMRENELICEAEVTYAVIDPDGKPQQLKKWPISEIINNP